MAFLKLHVTTLAVIVATFCFVNSQGATLNLTSCPMNVQTGGSNEIIFELSGTLSQNAAESVRFLKDGNSPTADCFLLFGAVDCSQTRGYCRCENDTGTLSFHYTIENASASIHDGNWTTFIDGLNEADRVRSPSCQISVAETSTVGTESSTGVSDATVSPSSPTANVNVNSTRHNCTEPPCYSDLNTGLVIVLYILSLIVIVCIVLQVKSHAPVDKKYLTRLSVATIIAVVLTCIFVLVVGLVTMDQCAECFYHEVRILHDAAIGSLVIGVICACVGGGVTAYSIYIIRKPNGSSSGKQGGAPRPQIYKKRNSVEPEDDKPDKEKPEELRLHGKNATNSNGEGGGGTEK